VNVHPRSDEVPPTEYFLGLKKGDLTTTVGKTEVTYKAGADFSANVILAYWGFNESFKGAAGLADFKQALDEYLKKQLAADYGKGHPKIVLLSPIAHENVKDPTDYPDGAANNKNLALYTQAMAEVAKANDVQFVDLFAASQQLTPGRWSRSRSMASISPRKATRRSRRSSSRPSSARTRRRPPIRA